MNYRVLTPVQLSNFNVQLPGSTHMRHRGPVDHDPYLYSALDTSVHPRQRLEIQKSTA